MNAGEAERRDNEHSSGGAVIAVRDGAPHVALIATRSKTRWGLPKGRGHRRARPPKRRRLREVREETGIEARIVRPLTRSSTPSAPATR